ncbi:MAG: type II toxin-antitoxin system RelE/ParE family toxin [Candidatus Micrarchaeota archaeon]
METEEFSAWFDSLDDDAKEDVVVKVEVLKTLGPALGRPLADTLKGSKHANMKELRVPSKGRPLRVLFAFDPKRQAVLLVGGNKEGDKQFYDKMISQADKLFDEYLAELRSELEKAEKEKKNGKHKR